MDGRPLVQAFEAEPRLTYKPTWEPPAATDGQFGQCDQLSPDEAAATLDHLVDEGYLKREQIVDPRAAERTADAADFNLAEVHLEQGRVARAAELLQALVERRPGVPRWALKLAQCRLALGDAEGCRRIVEDAVVHGVPPAYARRILAQLLCAGGKYDEALAELFEAEQVDPRQAGIHCEIGEVYGAMRRWDEARRAFEKELQRDPDSALSHTGLGKIAMENEDYELAVEELLMAISLWQSQPRAHLLLGTALEKLGKITDAIRAFERTLALEPNARDAHRHLAQLYEREGQVALAARHRKLAGDWRGAENQPGA
jgi:tetratricopeptide (TPR) repeat protein